MTSQLNVGLLIGSATDPDQLIRSTLGDEPVYDALSRASGRKINTTVVSWLPSKLHPEGYSIASSKRQNSLADRFLNGAMQRRLYNTFQKFPAGRLVNSLSPLDQSRVFWRAVRADPAVRSALEQCDVLIAVDLAAVRAAWELRRASINGAEAFYGLGSSLKVFNSRYLDATPS